jgi:hypothetical protein
MLLKLALLTVLAQTSVYNPPLQLKSNKLYPMTVDTYIRDNSLTPFVLYTVLKSCCRCILLYHSINNSYHGNTTLANFQIDQYLQSSLKHTDKKKLTKEGKYADYTIFFNDYYDTMMHQNQHFEKMFKMYNASFMTKI